jgi:hypothetical protein
MKKEKTIDTFLDEELLSDEVEKKEKNRKKLNEKTGLIERIDRVLVTSDGRQLLRERY